MNIYNPKTSAIGLTFEVHKKHLAFWLNYLNKCSHIFIGSVVSRHQNKKYLSHNTCSCKSKKTIRPVPTLS